MKRYWQHCALTLAASVAVASCATVDEELAYANHRTPRRVIEADWDTVAVARFEESDTTVLYPMHIHVNDAGIWLNDAGANRIALLSHDGVVQWTAGRSGEAPGEFRSVRDIESVDSMTVGVLDPANARISVIDRHGVVIDEIPVANAGHAEEFAPLGDGTYMLVTMRPDSPLVHVTSDGQVLARHALPWAKFAQLEPIASQNHTAAFPDAGGSWVLGLTLGEVFFVYRGAAPAIAPVSYVEWIEPPDVEPSRSADGQTIVTELPSHPFSGIGVSLDSESLYVLFGGRTGDRGRLVDVYSVADGAYQGSYRLPGKPSGFAVHHGRFYLRFDSPVPRIVILQNRQRP